MSNTRHREMSNSPRGRALVRRAGAPLPDDPRERMKDQGRLPAPVEVKPTLAELQAKHGPNWGLGGVLPSNEVLMASTGARPMTRDQAFPRGWQRLWTSLRSAMSTFVCRS